MMADRIRLWTDGRLLKEWNINGEKVTLGVEKLNGGRKAEVRRQMNKGFDKATFKKSVIDNVKNMFRKTIDEATPSRSSRRWPMR